MKYLRFWSAFWNFWKKKKYEFEKNKIYPLKTWKNELFICIFCAYFAIFMHILCIFCAFSCIFMRIKCDFYMHNYRSPNDQQERGSSRQAATNSIGLNEWAKRFLRHHRSSVPSGGAAQQRLLRLPKGKVPLVRPKASPWIDPRFLNQIALKPLLSLRLKWTEAEAISLSQQSWKEMTLEDESESAEEGNDGGIHTFMDGGTSSLLWSPWLQHCYM